MIVGTGPGPIEYLTCEARKILEDAPRILFRYTYDPVAKWLIASGKDFISFERLYGDSRMTYKAIYRLIVNTIIKEAKLKGRAVFALPGNPVVFEKTPKWILDQIKENGDDIKMTIIPGLSFLEILYPLLGVDPEEGLLILNASRMVELPDIYAPAPRVACIIGQLGLPMGRNPTGSETNIKSLVNILLKHYPPDHRVVIAWSYVYSAYSTSKIETTVSEILSYEKTINFLTSLYIPPISG